MPIPPKGSIPGRKPGRKPRASSDAGLGNPLGGVGGLLDGLLKGLGKTVGGIQNLNLGDLEKLAETQGNEEAQENIKELKEKLGKMEEKGIDLGDLFSQGFDLNKIIEFVTKHGGEFSKEFAGGKGIVRSGLRGHILGKRLGGDLPLDRRGPQETKFEVGGTRPVRTKTKAAGVQVSEETEVREVEIDPIEEDENHLVLRGYLAGVAKEDVTCEVQENGTILKISTEGERKYEKKVELPSKVTKKVNWSYKNGVLEVTLRKEP